MTELQMFTAMLNRAVIGYGLRDDPDGTAVRVESGEWESDFQVTEFAFDKDGQLTGVECYKGEIY